MQNILSSDPEMHLCWLDQLVAMHEMMSAELSEARTGVNEKTQILQPQPVQQELGTLSFET